MDANPTKHSIQKSSSSRESLFHRIKTNGLIIMILFFLSGLGIAITDFSPQYGVWFWIFLTLVFAGVSFSYGLNRPGEPGRTGIRSVPTWILHWLGLLLALLLVLFLETSGRMNSADAGLTSLLVVAIVTFLAGVHGDWRFGMVGILLGLAVGGAAYVEEYFWMMLIPFILAVIVGILWVWHRKKRG
ncbi:MAG: hypothetical protein R6U38_14655 [Desulfatiglandaceae bacterium]